MAYFRSNEVVSREMDGEAVIVRLADRKVFVFNAAATALWRLLEKGIGDGAVPEGAARFLGELVSKGLASEDESKEAGAPQSAARLSGEPAIKTEEALDAVAATCNSAHSSYPACRATEAVCGFLFE